VTCSHTSSRARSRTGEGFLPAVGTTWLSAVVIESPGSYHSCRLAGIAASSACAVRVASAARVPRTLSLRSALSILPRVARSSAWSIERENRGANAAHVATSAEMSTRTKD